MSDDKDILILALKAANKGKGIVICNLIKESLLKDDEITVLRRRVEFLEKWARWNKKGSGGDMEGSGESWSG